MTPQEISDLLRPYTQRISMPPLEWSHVCSQLNVYLDLILKWNSRTNLTAIRTSEEIVRRHFGESLFAGSHIGDCSTLLDFGSGAGFPGIPVQLLRPDIEVTLAESQGKKAAFLREACRELSIAAKVFPSRVESMPMDRQFDVVMLRAVDNMSDALAEATRRARREIMAFTTLASETALPPVSGFRRTERFLMPLSDTAILDTYRHLQIA